MPKVIPVAHGTNGIMQAHLEEAEPIRQTPAPLRFCLSAPPTLPPPEFSTGRMPRLTDLDWDGMGGGEGGGGDERVGAAGGGGGASPVCYQRLGLLLAS